jgi:hypothetical protein
LIVIAFFVIMWLVQVVLLLWIVHLYKQLRHQRQVSRWLAHDLARVVKEKLKLQRRLIRLGFPDQIAKDGADCGLVKSKQES